MSAKSEKPKYPRVRAWIAMKRYLPRKLEFYGMTGSLIKTVRYEDYRNTSIGLRSMRLEVDSSLDMNRKTSMVFTNLHKVNAAPVDFSPEGMRIFRDAAIEKMDSAGVAAHADDLLKVLAGGKK